MLVHGLPKKKKKKKTTTTTTQQGEKNFKKAEEDVFLIGKSKSFSLIDPINLQISQKLDHFSKNLLLIIINFVSFSMILNNS